MFRLKSQHEYNIVNVILQDDDFRSPVSSYPFNVTLGSHLNVAVLLRTELADVKEVVSECWATPDADSSSNISYPLIANKYVIDICIKCDQLVICM